MQPPQIEAPTIVTERTVMRAHRLSDFDAYAAMQADPAVIRFIGGMPRTREESWLRFLRHPGLWAMLGFGYWAIEDRATGAFIGEAGFHDMLRDMSPSIEGVPEAGWSLVGSVHGRGLATEVVRAMHGWADSQLRPDSTVCIIDPVHTISIRLALASGYRREAETQYKGAPILLFRRLRAGQGPGV